MEKLALRVAAVCGFIVLAAAGPLSAKITSINVTRVQNEAFGGRVFAVGKYERWKGTVHGVVDPADPHNSFIVNIDRAKNAAGLVEYDVDVDFFKPQNPRNGTNHLYYDVLNRGNKLAIGFVNSGGGGNEPTTAAHAGTGFLMDRGFTIVWSGWQADVAPGVGRLVARFPTAKNAGAPIVGVAREEFIVASNASPFTATLAYPAATVDPDSATLTVRENETDARERPPGLSFTFISDTRVSITRPSDPRFDGGAIYEFIYEARDPFVAGLALAATRDVISFLRYETRAADGTANPLAGALPRHALAAGVSQSGRFLRDLIYLTGNVDERGRQVMDGANPIIAGSRKTFTNYAFAQPGRFSRQHEDHLFPGDQFPFTYTMLTDPISGRRDSILARCEAFRSCPKVVHTDSDTEIWQARGALVTTSPEGETVDLPDSVRAYLFAGTQHGPAAQPEPITNPPAADPTCKQLTNPLQYAPMLRAVTAALDDWASRNRAPPRSRYPTLDDRTLVRPDEVRFPTFGNVIYNGKTNVLHLTDQSVQPPFLGPAYPDFVGRTDRDGNTVGGVRHPFLEVPIATYAGWNLRVRGQAENELCSLTGSYIPFKRTRAERMAAGDPRPSLQERYRSHQQYVKEVARAAERLVRERLLLESDADDIVAAADRANVP